MDWFLYDNGLRHERVNVVYNPRENIWNKVAQDQKILITVFAQYLTATT